MSYILTSAEEISVGGQKTVEKAIIGVLLIFHCQKETCVKNVLIKSVDDTNLRSTVSTWKIVKQKIRKKSYNVIAQGEVPGKCNDVAISRECLSFAKV